MTEAHAWTADEAARECRVASADIRRLAEWMAEADPLVLAPGNGLEHGRNGGSVIRAAIALPALLGKLGRHSGIVLGASNAFPKTPAKLQRPDLLPPGTRTINILDVGRHLERDDLDLPLRAVFIYNHNPVVVHPDQNRLKRGLARGEIFLVGIDIAMTESMQFCDIVLPAASHFECDDLYPSYGHHWLQRAEPVIPPIGEALPNTEIFRRLAARVSFDDECFQASDRDLMDDAVDPGDPRLHGRRGSDLPVGKAVRMSGPDGQPLALLDNVMPATPSGKIELASEVLAARWGDTARLPGYRLRASKFPLSLISPSSTSGISSTLLGRGGKSREAPPLMMHPDDARSRGLTDKTSGRVWNNLGAAVLKLQVTDSVQPGVVASEKGAWLATSPTGQTISALVSADDRADLAEGACFNDTSVEVSAV
jgi:anaerobic selenocysteine-containing dehydrogenase